MNSPFSSKARENLAFGLFLIVLAAAILFFSRSIRVNDFGNHDPGPRAIPIATAVIMLLGGIFEVVSAIRLSRCASAAVEKNIDAEATSSTDWKRGMFTLLGLLVYLFAMSWIGFMISTLIYASTSLIMLGSRWWTAILSSVCIVVLVQVLFVKLFHVSLPSGSLGFF